MKHAATSSCIRRSRGTTAREWAGSRGRIGRSHFESVVHDPATDLVFRLRTDVRW